MPRLRLAIKKEGALQFLSHLGFARAVRYVIVRANLPVCYSEGFNPHMKINFASALGVGVSAAVEYMDMELAGELPIREVMDRMNAKSPQGFAVLDGAYVPDKAPKLMAMGNYATFELRGPVVRDASEAEIEEAAQRFNDQAEVLYTKVSPKNGRKHVIDVKQHVPDNLTVRMEHGQLYVCVGILQTQEGGIKPQQLWEILEEQFGLPVAADMMLAHRTGIYHREGCDCSTLFDLKDGVKQ